MFEFSAPYDINGRAVYVNSAIVAKLQSDSFFNCQSGTAAGTYTYQGACVWLVDVKSASAAADCCATQCGACVASFAYINSGDVDVYVTGLAAFNCRSASGAITHLLARLYLTTFNFTDLDGTWGSRDALASAIHQSERGSSTRAILGVFHRCWGGSATLRRYGGNTATLRECLLVASSGAVGHGMETTGRDSIELCYFQATSLRGTQFSGGSVLVKDCLFATYVPAMPVSFVATGVQRGYAATRMNVANPSLLATCPSQGIAAFGPTATPMASRTGTKVIPTPTPVESPADTPLETPLISATASRPFEASDDVGGTIVEPSGVSASDDVGGTIVVPSGVLASEGDVGATIVEPSEVSASEDGPSPSAVRNSDGLAPTVAFSSGTLALEHLQRATETKLPSVAGFGSEGGSPSQGQIEPELTTDAAEAKGFPTLAVAIPTAAAAALLVGLGIWCMVRILVWKPIGDEEGSTRAVNEKTQNDELEQISPESVGFVAAPVENEFGVDTIPLDEQVEPGPFEVVETDSGEWAEQPADVE
jgi:hypothetical protein